MNRQKAEWLALALLVIGLAFAALWLSGPDLSDLKTALEKLETLQEAEPAEPLPPGRD